MVREKEYREREFISGSGIYCFFPFDNLDKNNKGVFKIGMTGNFHKRIGSYHTYLPEGVYYKCFLKNPTKLKGDMDTQKYYTMIEKEIFKNILEFGGKSISMHIRIKDEGRTEWVYANSKMIEDAFDLAYQKYGGKNTDLTIYDFKILKKKEEEIKKNSIYKGEIYFTT